MNPAAPPAPSLLSWLQSGGGATGPIELDHHPDRGLGVVAREDIPAKQDILEVPAWMLLTPARGVVTPAGQALSRQGSLLAPTPMLTLALLHELDDPRSLFGPWLGLLPDADFAARFPVTWSEERLALLRGTRLLDFVRIHQQELAQEHASIAAALPGWEEDVPLSRWVHARLVVGSRTFRVTMGGRPGIALVPAVDCLNHAEEPDVGWAWDDRMCAFHAWTLREVRAGEALCNSYGYLTNGRSLFSYGFHQAAGTTGAGRSRDDLYLPMDPSPEDEALLRRFLPSGALDAVSLVPDYDHPDTRRGLAILRVMLANEQERRFLSMLTGQPDHPLPPLSPRDELACVEWLANRARQDLARLGRTPPGDSPWHHSAEVIRQGERSTCEQILDLAAVVPPLFDQDASAGRRALQAATGFTRSYLETVVLPMLPEGA